MNNPNSQNVYLAIAKFQLKNQNYNETQEILNRAREMCADSFKVYKYSILLELYLNEDEKVQKLSELLL